MPLYRAVAQAIAEGIDQGELRPGGQLPTQRELARRLGIALTTVMRGYAEAERRGLVRGEVGRGTFVRAGQPSAGNGAGEGTADLRANSLLPYPLLPELQDRIARTLMEADAPELFGYGPWGGRERHREAGARLMRALGLSATVDRVLVTAGAQHAMAVVFATILEPGDALLVEEVTYAGMKSLANLLGIRLEGLPMDAEGLLPDALRAACVEGGRVLYTMPTLQNPTSGVMSGKRRHEVATIAAETGLTIVEDDSYGFLFPDPPRLAAISEGAYHLTGTSKSLLPGLRVGFVHAPAAMVARLEAAISATIYLASPMTAQIVTDWVADGTAERVMTWKREEIANRQSIARRLFADADYQGHPAAPHGWLRLPEPWTVRDFVAQAAMRGVHVTPADAFAVGRNTSAHAVRIAVGPVTSRAVLEDALASLAEMLHEGPEAGRAVV